MEEQVEKTYKTKSFSMPSQPGQLVVSKGTGGAGAASAACQLEPVMKTKARGKTKVYMMVVWEWKLGDDVEDDGNYLVPNWCPERLDVDEKSPGDVCCCYRLIKSLEDGGWIEN